MKKAYLILENGTCFEGFRIGAEKEADGELVFTTGVVGYLESLTDPSYAGQIILQTFPLIGNYGVMEEDLEGPCLAAGYVVRQLCDIPSNFRSEYALDEYLKKEGVPGICGVDTRALTRMLRENGTLRAVICDEKPEGSKCFFVEEPSVKHAGCTERKTFLAENEKKYSVLVLDFGIPKSMVSALVRRGCEVTLLSKNVPTEEILALEADGVLISPGPGNPEEYTVEIAEIQNLIGNIPVLGIGLGHQLCALAMGGKTSKLPYGHRGSNYPVKAADGRIYIVQQNHGYAVNKESLPGAGELFVNLHDSTNEGLIYPGKKCFTVQFTPSGDTQYIYDAFIKEMGAWKDAER